MNRHSAFVRLELVEQCAYEGVALVFKHLTIDQIRNPPRAYFDAKLARQIAIRIQTVDFYTPRRRVTIMQDRRRASIGFAVQAVDRRLEDTLFRVAYERMAAYAVALYDLRMRQAA